MEQLTLDDLYKLALSIKNKGVDLKTIQVYIGDDEELNGIHTAWCYSPISKIKGKNEDNDYILELLEMSGNVPIKEGAILIS